MENACAKSRSSNLLSEREGLVQMELGLRGKVALVAGGSKGIGRAIALELAAEGAAVAVAARQETALDEVTDELRRRGAESVAVSADLTRTVEVARTIDQVVEAFRRLDILINNV